MKCKDSNFWIGLGIGSVAGALAYHCLLYTSDAADE